MKLKTKIQAIIMIVMLITISTKSFASFPLEAESSKKTEVKSTILTSIEKINAEVKKSNPSNEATINLPEKDKDNDKLITILLWFFLGVFAAHRWYKKKPVGWNILFILTLGGCGVWAIIDLVHIIQDKF
jgi:hypothetical protein